MGIDITIQRCVEISKSSWLGYTSVMIRNNHIDIDNVNLQNEGLSYIVKANWKYVRKIYLGICH